MKKLKNKKELKNLKTVFLFLLICVIVSSFGFSNEQKIFGYNDELIFISEGKELNNETNISGIKNVEIYEKNNDIQELKIVFDFDFENNTLNLSSISLITEKQEENKSFGYTIINGLEGILKNIFVKKITNYDFVCLKDSQINNISDFSTYCNYTNETILKCENTDESFDYKILNNEKRCFIFNNTYIITGVINSGIIEGCFPNYTCSEWSSCISGLRSRTCYDLNNCLMNITETENCVCVSNWSCSEWSSCVYQKRKRTCVDVSNCSSQRIEEESCTCITSYTDCSEWSDCVNGVSTRICEDVNECSSSSIVETRNCSQNTQQNTIQNIQAAKIFLNVSNTSNQSKNNNEQDLGVLNAINSNESLGNNELRENSEEQIETYLEFNEEYNENNSLEYNSKTGFLSNYKDVITGFVTKNLNQVGNNKSILSLIIFISLISLLIMTAVYIKNKNKNRIIIDVNKLEKRGLFKKKNDNKDRNNRKIDF
ncbi:MAG: hypothetical protein QXU20_03155 [Candidatus Woesearchaeota archaeon]